MKELFFLYSWYEIQKPQTEQYENGTIPVQWNSKEEGKGRRKDGRRNAKKKQNLEELVKWTKQPFKGFHAPEFALLL